MVGQAEWQKYLLGYQDGCIGAVVLDEGFRIRAVSEALLEQSGYRAEEAEQLTALDVIHPDDVERAAEILVEVQGMAGQRSEGMYRFRFEDGSYHQLSVQLNGLGPEHDNILVYRLSDVSERLRLEAFAEDVVDSMRMISEERPLTECIDWIMRVGERHINDATFAITVFSEEGDVRTFSRTDLPEVVRRDNAAAHPLSLPAHVQRALDQHNRGPWRAFNQMGTLDDSLPGRVTSILVDTHQEVLGYVESFRSSTDEPSESEWLVHGLIRRVATAVIQRQRLDLQLRRAADHDPLTGLVNRRRLLTDMERSAQLAGSAIVVLDLDGFSWINNTLGHQAGDETLAAAAACLSDACPDDAIVARMGGDEFVVWAPAVTDANTLEVLASAI
ncbi:MAG: sensor domain-containing diguanylate cyclase, partial [Acidimicrobiia bacterium]|nr:sensor domain-containing diguanylate cyclase [Acidimicrobiia bacterium]